MVINRGRRSKTKNEVKPAQNVKKISRFQWLFKWQVRCKKKLCYLVSYFIIHNSFLLTSFSNPVNKNQFRKSMYVWWSKQFFYHINFYMLYNLLVNFFNTFNNKIKGLHSKISVAILWKYCLYMYIFLTHKCHRIYTNNGLHFF